MDEEKQDAAPEPTRVARYCPLCAARAESVTVRALGGNGETRLVHVSCRRCHAASLALVLSRGEEASSVGIVTDLSHEDVRRVARMRAVSVDDVIDAHGLFSGEAWKGLTPRPEPRRKSRSAQNGGKSRRSGSA
jgi:hypothetical protein